MDTPPPVLCGHCTLVRPGESRELADVVKALANPGHEEDMKRLIGLWCGDCPHVKKV